MNLSTVITNLKNTIAGKEKMLAGLQECIRGLEAIDCQDDSWFRATVTVEFLEINIDELKNILRDVEVCCKQASDDRWITNPDRMGGQFTQDEIYDITSTPLPGRALPNGKWASAHTHLLEQRFRVIRSLRPATAGLLLAFQQEQRMSSSRNLRSRRLFRATTLVHPPMC